MPAHAMSFQLSGNITAPLLDLLSRRVWKMPLIKTVCLARLESIQQGSRLSFPLHASNDD